MSDGERNPESILRELCDQVEHDRQIFDQYRDSIAARLRNLERDVAKLREAHAYPAPCVNGAVGPYTVAAAAMRLAKDTIEGCSEVNFSMAENFVARATVNGRWHVGCGVTLVAAVGDLYGNCAKAGLKVKGVTPPANPSMSA